MTEQIKSLCAGLVSTRILERKSSCEKLYDLLHNKSTVKALDGGENEEDWNSLFDSALKGLFSFVGKLEEHHEKGKVTQSTSTLTNMQRCNDLVFTIVKTANRNGGVIEFHRFFKLLRKCIRIQTLKTHCLHMYMTLFRDHILPKSEYWGSVSVEDWTELFQMMKKLHSEFEPLSPLMCLLTMINNGLDHRIPLRCLIEEAPFISGVCEAVDRSSSRWVQEAVLKLFLTFCKLSLNDCRMLCCNLGENVLNRFLQLYSCHDTLPDVYYLMLESMVLQINIHHPNGVLQNHGMATAGSWANWNSVLRSAFVLCNEMLNKKDKVLIDGTTTKKRLHPLFVNFAVEVYHQVCGSGERRNVPMPGPSNDVEFRAKRMCYDTGLTYIVEQIKDYRDWMWISFLTEILKKYPEMISIQDYERLLQFLADYLPECNTYDLRGHIFLCLDVLLSIENVMEKELDNNKLEVTWLLLWNFTLKSLALNQDQEETHCFMQQLIVKKQPTQQYRQQLQSAFPSKTILLSDISLQTLELVGRYHDIPESLPNLAESPRNLLLQWIFRRTKECTHFGYRITATVLAQLTLNQYPNELQSKCPAPNIGWSTDNYSVHTLTKDVSGAILAAEENIPEKSYVVNREVLASLLLKLQELFVEILEKQEKEVMYVANAALLYAHLLDATGKYGIDAFAVEIVKMLERVLASLWAMIDSIFNHITEKRNKHEPRIWETVSELFKIDDKLGGVVRRTVTRNLVKTFFGILSDDDNDGADPTSSAMQDHYLEKSQRKKESLRLMSQFCIPCTDETQEKVLNTLVEYDVDPTNSLEYEMAMIILNTIKCRKEPIPEQILKKIFLLIQKICVARYKDSTVAEDILNCTCYLYLHVANTDSPELRNIFIMLLKPFYEARDCYGPKVSIAICNCMGQIAEADPLGVWAIWQIDEVDRNVICYLPRFLSSPYMAVRMAAIENLVKPFQYKNTSGSTLYTKQRELFDEMLAVCNEVFTREFDGNNVDELVNYEASTFYAFGMVVVNNCTLRQHVLFHLLTYVRRNCACKLNADKLLIVIGKISKQLGMTSSSVFLEHYLSYLLLKWSSHKFSLKDFPVTLYECKDNTEFYKKYMSHIIPILINEEDTVTFESICTDIGKSLKEVIEVAYPKIVAKNLVLKAVTEARDQFKITPQDISFSENIQKRIKTYLSEEMTKRITKEQSHEIIVHIIQFVFDLNHFQKLFDVEYTIPEPDTSFLSVEIFKGTLGLLENTIGTSFIIQDFASHDLSKLQHLLLLLKLNVYKAVSTEDKLLAFHRYVIYLQLHLRQAPVNKIINPFFIRDTSCTLINFIQEAWEEDGIFNQLAATYFLTFLGAILPSESEIFVQLVVYVVSNVVSIANTDTKLASIALTILRKIILENEEHLKPGIQILDPFPDGAKFDELRSVYLNVRYGTKPCDLRTEIEYFLEASEHIKVNGCRVEGLRHLRRQLVGKKDELKALYADLRLLKGCLDDRSILHKLICCLVQLTKSGNNKECSEAARCLGELGPADLKTMVLKTENPIETSNITLSHYPTLFVIQLLLEYIVDKNHEILVDASTALSKVVSSLEGKQLLQKTIDRNLLDVRYLLPFKGDSQKPKSHQVVDDVLFSEMIGDIVLWCPSAAMSHCDFIKTLTTRILGCFVDSSFYTFLIPIVKNKVSFGEKMLPILVHVILGMNKTCHKVISNSVSTFFATHWALHWSGSGSSDSVVEHKASVQCMLETVQFVRLQNSIATTAKPELSVNYLHVALAAQFCSAYCSAILYAELWCQSKAMECYGSANIKTVGHMSAFEIVCENCEDSKELQTILRQTYIDIGDKNGLHNDQLKNPLNIDSQMMVYEDLNRKDLIALVRCFQAKQRSYDPDMSQALWNLSQPEIAMKYSMTFGELPYEYMKEAMWSLSCWDELPLPRSADVTDYHQCNYLALRAFRDGNTFTFSEAIDTARLNVMEELRHESLEICKNLYAPLAKLQCLQEIEDVKEVDEGNTLNGLTLSWQLKDSINKNSFQYFEPIMRQRICILKVLLEKGFDCVRDILIITQLDLAKTARFDGNLYVAIRSVIELMNMNNLSDEFKSKVMLEGAQISWNVDQTYGIRVLKHLLQNYKEDSMVRSEALNLYGSWMVERKAESSQTIISNYFLESISVLNNLKNRQGVGSQVENFHASYDTLARFADRQYQEIYKYTKSCVFQDKIQNMEKLVKSAEDMKSSKQAKQGDVRKSIAICERQSALDRNEIDNTHKEKNAYLQLAIKYYLFNLHYSSENDISIFRIFSLWLENKSNPTVMDIISKNLPKVPSYKALQILPQLVPHISNNTGSDAFGKEVNLLIERCAIDHPHHAIPIILSVANSNKDADYEATPANIDLNEPRVVASLELIQKLKSQSPKLKSIMQEMENTVDAIVELAYFDCGQDSNNPKPVKFPSNFKINRVKGHSSALLPTINLPVNINCNYDTVTGIHRYQSEFSLVGGLNAPKRIKCIGTDGIIRSQLVKGKDDLRQDAVMQQVFTIINGLLSTEKSTENLLIRTYKIVPMSKRSGLLEWVDNSMPFGDYLVGKQGAHRMYNKGDLTPEKCRLELKKLASVPNDVKLKKYLLICEKFRPAFHKFFETTFIHPTVWYEKKRSYTHSVATTSMCGYILGIGDRHVNNILIDKKTAEVIHIDFGIAFEQAKVLPTPETIPFRLTRDIEAGMGIFGCEGTFRRSCEMTMEVLRNNANTILAILEVLLYDPLYDWSITPTQAYSRQFDSDSENVGEHIVFSNEENVQLNVRAERALNRLRDKLQGTESGGFMSIQGQVTYLIQQARDPANLCRLFHGWQPYL